MKPAAFILAVAALCCGFAGGSVAQSTAPNPSQITLIVGSSPGSLVDAAAQLLGAQLASAGYEVDFQNMPGDLGRDASRHVVQSLSRPDIMLVTENLTLAIQDARGIPLINGLLPVAKLSNGLSTVLFVPGTSPLQNWQAFIAGARQKRLRAASNGRTSELSIPLTLIEKRWGVRFDDVEVSDTSQIVGAVVSGAADFAMVTLDELVAYNGRAAEAAASQGRVASIQPADGVPPVRQALRPLMTFAAERSPLTPEVPTLAEMSRDRRMAFTISFGAYSPLGISASALTGLRAAALGANDNAEVQKKAADRRFPFVVSGPDVLRETLARDKRTAEAIVSARGSAR